MSTLPPVGPSTMSLALLREMLAVILVVAGCAGLVVAGFLWCVPAGVAALSVVSLSAGAALGYER